MTDSRGMSHGAVASPAARTATAPGAQRRNPLWFIVLAAFALQIAAWTAWFLIARQHQVAEVPLATKGAP